MTYEVVIVHDGGREEYRPTVGRRAAIRAAKDEAAASQSSRVYIAWHRSSDGQHGYLNPPYPGHHSITGRPW